MRCGSESTVNFVLSYTIKFRFFLSGVTWHDVLQSTHWKMFLLCSVSHSLQLSAIGDDEGSISFFIVRFRCEFHCSLDLSKVSILLSFKLGKISQECRNLFVGYKHPYVCCKYPQRKVLPAHEENCKSKCSHENKCCVLDCTYRETGVVLDGVFNDYAMVKLYENIWKILALANTIGGWLWLRNRWRNVSI